MRTGILNTGRKRKLVGGCSERKGRLLNESLYLPYKLVCLHRAAFWLMWYILLPQVTFFSHSCTQHSNHHQRGHHQIAKDSPAEEIITDNTHCLYISIMHTGAAYRNLAPSPVFLLCLPSLSPLQLHWFGPHFLKVSHWSSCYFSFLPNPFYLIGLISFPKPLNISLLCYQKWTNKPLKN